MEYAKNCVSRFFMHKIHRKAFKDGGNTIIAKVSLTKVSGYTVCNSVNE